MATAQLVSIIIPAWKATWFETALQSALQQDYPACEIIIGDDSQDDAIAAMVARLRPTARWPIAYHRNRPSLGESQNGAACLAKAQGDYIKFLHDDDVLEPTCVSRLVQAMAPHPTIVMATAQRLRIDAQGDPLPPNEGNTPLFQRDSVLHGGDIINFTAGRPLNFIGEPSVVLFRAAALRATLQQDALHMLAGQSMPFLADLALYIKVLRFGHLAFVSQPLARYRISRSQTLSTSRSKEERVLASWRNLPQAIKQRGWHDPTRSPDRIRVAPLAQPTAFSECDLIQAIRASLRQSQLTLWLDSRALCPARQALSQQFFAARAAARCTLFIDARGGDGLAWARTLASLPASTPGLSWQLIALTDGGVDALPATTERLSLAGAAGIHALNARCRTLDSDWLLFVAAGSRLLPSGLNALAGALTAAEGCQAIYADGLYAAEGAPSALLFRPDFSLDFFLSSPAQMARHWLFRREWVVAEGGFDPASPQAFELACQLRLIESTGAAAIGHLTEPLVEHGAPPTPWPEERALLLAHLRRRGFEHAQVEPAPHGLWRLHYRQAATPLVTIALLAYSAASAARGLSSLLATTRYAHYEVLIVAAECDDARALPGLVQLAPARIRLVPFAGRWRRAAMANSAILNARGDYLLFLHADIQVAEPDWLEAMLNHALRPEVAIVGAKQLYPGDRVRHAGYLLGMRGAVAGEPFYGAHDASAGYMRRLHADQNYSAVSADFMLVSKATCLAADGFDADLASHDDVDFCLRVAALGGLIVWTPYARGYRQPERAPSAVTAAQREAETDALFARWLPILSQDPAYNRNFSLASDFALPADLRQSAPPLAWRPLPLLMAVLHGECRTRDWRLVAPFNALRRAGRLDGKMGYGLPALPEVARDDPDVMLIELQQGEAFARWLRRLSHAGSAFRIAAVGAPAVADACSQAEIDARYARDLANARRHLACFDRLVVPDAQMADLFAHDHPNIAVLPTRLPARFWTAPPRHDRLAGKPRIGWQSALCHGRTLALIAELVSAFADEVEWVVYGDCPAALRSQVQRVYPATDTERIPQALALLDLDLALVLHDGHALTHALASAQLLEYGATAIPVICSDSLRTASLYRVTAVANRMECWREAIRGHLADLDASRKQGRRLQSDVRQHSLLDEAGLSAWLSVWATPG